MNYFICGFTGAGKTTLLKGWSLDPCLTKYSFIDLDTYIHQKFSTYCSLGDLIRDKGFDFFRDQELMALKELAANDQQIVSLGGGTLRPETLEVLKGWSGFWLNTDFETCYQRIQNDKNRPLSDRSKEELFQLYHERSQIYAQFDEVSLEKR